VDNLHGASRTTKNSNHATEPRKGLVAIGARHAQGPLRRACRGRWFRSEVGRHGRGASTFVRGSARTPMQGALRQLLPAPNSPCVSPWWRKVGLWRLRAKGRSGRRRLPGRCGSCRESTLSPKECRAQALHAWLVCWWAPTSVAKTRGWRGSGERRRVPQRQTPRRAPPRSTIAVVERAPVSR